MPAAPKPPADLVSLRLAREKAIADLSDAFAHDVIDVTEFEHRLTLAHRASTLAEIAETVSDLTDPAASTAIVAPFPATAPMSVSAGDRGTDSIMAVFGGVERHGAWTVPAHLRVMAILGGASLDLREAKFLPGVTEIQVVAVMGGVQFIVPPGLSVEVSGTAVMGGFGHVDRAPSQTDPERSVLRVHGLAIMGGVAVETRLPGESETDAHRRRHRGALGSADELRRLPPKPHR
jgi:hypothetical protein